MKARPLASAILAPLLLVALWEVAVRAFKIPPYLLPSPKLVANAFAAAPKEFLGHATQTAGEALFGFLIALVAGVFGGCALYRFGWIRQIALPWTSALQAIPIIAIAPLLVVWMGSGMGSKVAMSAIISFFPILNSVMTGFMEVDHDRRLLFRIYGTGYLKTLFYLLFPSALPTIVMGLKLSAGLATVGAIVAEMTGADKGLGQVLLIASYRSDTPRMFVAIILSGLIGWLAYSFPSVLRLLLPRYWESSRRRDGA